MRGVPGNPVVCRTCTEKKAAPKDRLCNSCRMKSRPNARKKFFSTEEYDSRLRAAYRASTRDELSRHLDHLQRLTQFTRVVILSRAAELGLSFGRRRAWVADEVEFVSDNLGKVSITAIARKLSRSYCSVRAQVRTLQFSARVTEGYSQQHIGSFTLSFRPPAS